MSLSRFSNDYFEIIIEDRRVIGLEFEDESEYSTPEYISLEDLPSAIRDLTELCELRLRQLELRNLL